MAEIPRERPAVDKQNLKFQSGRDYLLYKLLTSSFDQVRNYYTTTCVSFQTGASEALALQAVLQTPERVSRSICFVPLDLRQHPLPIVIMLKGQLQLLFNLSSLPNIDSMHPDPNTLTKSVH